MLRLALILSLTLQDSCLHAILAGVGNIFVMIGIDLLDVMTDVDCITTLWASIFFRSQWYHCILECDKMQTTF